MWKKQAKCFYVRLFKINVTTIPMIDWDQLVQCICNECFTTDCTVCRLRTWSRDYDLVKVKTGLKTEICGFDFDRLENCGLGFGLEVCGLEILVSHFWFWQSASLPAFWWSRKNRPAPATKWLMLPWSRATIQGGPKNGTIFVRLNFIKH